MNLNKVFLIGRLTQDPETRAIPSGQSVTTLRMATNRVWMNQAGQKQEGTEFHTVVAWGKIGEIASRYLKKGGLLMIEGRLQTRNWTDQNNNKRYMTEIIADGLQMGPRPQGSGAAPSASTVMSDTIKKSPVVDDIPIINENEPTMSGVEEGEVKIKEEDLPF